MGDRGAPAAYAGREQTYLKHRVLKEYLGPWAQKLGSTARYGQRRLWYVDCFAGLWRSQDPDGADTSVDIGLKALDEAIATWRGDRGVPLNARAIFVEADPGRANKLRALLGQRSGGVQAEVLEGEFGKNAPIIKERLGSDAAFLFVDPTGWKGADMAYIAELVGRPFRDVLVNVMFDYLNRWVSAPLPFLREQMERFFGLRADQVPADLDENALMAFYRGQMKQRCGIKWAADLAIPYPASDRTFFRLVVGGQDPEVLRLFRNVEEGVVGHEAANVRESAKKRKQEVRTGQFAFDLPGPTLDERYRRMRDGDLPGAVDLVEHELRGRGPQRFGDLWPQVLEGHHLTLRALSTAVLAAVRRRRFVAELGPRERVLKDSHVLRLGAG